MESTAVLVDRRDPPSQPNPSPPSVNSDARSPRGTKCFVCRSPAVIDAIRERRKIDSESIIPPFSSSQFKYLMIGYFVPVDRLHLRPRDRDLLLRQQLGMIARGFGGKRTRDGGYA